MLAKTMCTPVKGICLGIVSAHTQTSVCPWSQLLWVYRTGSGERIQEGMRLHSALTTGLLQEIRSAQITKADLPHLRGQKCRTVMRGTEGMVWW